MGCTKQRWIIGRKLAEFSKFNLEDQKNKSKQGMMFDD